MTSFICKVYCCSQNYLPYDLCTTDDSNVLSSLNNYTIIVVLCLLIELLNPPLSFISFFQMALFIIVRLAGIPIGVATFDNPKFWPNEEDKWAYVCFE